MLTYLSLRYDFDNIYLKLAYPQKHIQLYILGEKIGIYNQPDYRYIPGFIFWIEKYLSLTGQA